jgi:hypothetical protein
MQAKHRKTVAAIFAQPTRANIRFADIEALLTALGGELDEGAGSRVSFTLHDERLHLHRPHPGKEAKRYQVEQTREFLERLGVAP